MVCSCLDRPLRAIPCPLGDTARVVAAMARKIQPQAMGANERPVGPVQMLAMEELETEMSDCGCPALCAVC